MALVDVEEVKVTGQNPALFTAGYEFEITFECIEELSDDLEWKVVYVGSASDEAMDQTLEEVMVGPVPLGTSKFTLEAAAPDWSRIPHQDRLGVTVLNVCCSYKGQPFVNVGYYVNNEYYLMNGPNDGGKPTLDAAELPSELDQACVFRNVMVNEPRVTRYNIKWHLQPGEVLPEPPPTPRDLSKIGKGPLHGLAVNDDEDGDDLGDDDEDVEDALLEDDDEEIELGDDEDDIEDDDEEQPANKRQRTSELLLDDGGEDDDDDELDDDVPEAALYEEEDEQPGVIAEEEEDEEEEEDDDVEEDQDLGLDEGDVEEDEEEAEDP